MTDKKQITVNLGTINIEKLDKLCAKLDMNRAQVLRLLFSGNVKNIRFVCDALVSLEEGLFGGVYDQ